jgi:hypothetical protein
VCRLKKVKGGVFSSGKNKEKNKKNEVYTRKGGILWIWVSLCLVKGKEGRNKKN